MTKRVLAVGAHPDDIEIFMGGTFLLLAKAGYELHYLTIANGSGGTTTLDRATIATRRRDEARRAAARAGAVYHESMTNDLEVLYDRRLLGGVASIVRQVAPNVILTHAPDCYVEDHVNTSRLTVAAAFGRSMRNFFVDPPRPVISDEVTIYHAQPHLNRNQLRKFISPELYVDVGTTIDAKLKMLEEHESQRRWLGESQRMVSYLDTFRQTASELGKKSGEFEYAEGWRRHHHAGYCTEGVDPLRDALGERALVNEVYLRELG